MRAGSLARCSTDRGRSVRPPAPPWCAGCAGSVPSTQTGEGSQVRPSLWQIANNGFFVPRAAVAEVRDYFALWPAAAFVTAFGPFQQPNWESSGRSTG